jgi:large subunit ribosomal protein L23
MHFSEDIIIRPIMSEKSNDLESLNAYTFEVAPDVNKIQIKKAIEEIFSVTVLKVRTQRYLGKSVVKRFKRSRINGKKKNWKKAIVTLKSGDMIDHFKDVM